MAKPSTFPSLPDSPGAWIACFRQRVSLEGRSASPEQFGGLIGRSGATVRRWESNRQFPDEKDIARIAEVARLSPQQVAFLSAACSNMRALPAPDETEFRSYIGQVLSATSYPAIVVDGLFYVRAWNSRIEALATGNQKLFARGAHTIAMMLRAGPDTVFRPTEPHDSLRVGLRYFWMATAVHSHRPEYKALVNKLAQEPHFQKLWPDLALGDQPAEAEPITLERAILASGARFDVNAWPVWFPPSYHVYEYIPDDDLARSRLETVIDAGPPTAEFARRLHWVDCEESYS